MRLILTILLLTAICFSCKKDKVEPGVNVEIYLLKSSQAIPGKCQVDASSAVLQDIPIVKNQDVLAYSKTDYQFTISDDSIKKLRELADNAPFAVVVDKQVIYYGIVKPFYSSSTCENSITMNNFEASDKITMNLGYAGADRNIDDQRNNPKLLATLRNQGKLK